MIEEGLKQSAEGLVHGAMAGGGMAGITYRKQFRRVASKEEIAQAKREGDLSRYEKVQGKDGKTEYHEVTHSKSGLDWLASGLIHNPVTRALGIHDPLTKFAKALGLDACFAAGTKLLVRGEHGELTSKNIEEIRSWEDHGEKCDWLLSRDEYNVAGELQWERAEKRFERLGRIWTLHLEGGVVVRTTCGLKGCTLTPVVRRRCPDMD